MTRVKIPELDFQYRIKKDVYYREHQNRTSIVRIFCRECGTKLLLYQKDGKQGWLKWCYFDRIIKPWFNSRNSNMQCPKCNRVIGKKTVRKGRLSYEIIRKSFKRRTIVRVKG